MLRPLAILVLSATRLNAFAAPAISAVCNSAAAPGGRVELNADCAQAGDGPTTAALFWSSDSQVTWARLDLARHGEPGFDSTFAGVITAPSSGTVHYYVRASDGDNWSTQAPFNAANRWPPAPGLLASTADEPAGDANDPEGDWLDLTGAFVGYSATHFYVALSNNHNSWPTYSFPQPWYIYSLGFVNPAAPSDTWAFAVSYANIPAVYTTGLYAINRYANSFERVADAEAVTAGNRLSLRCPIASFTGDPRFGPWPNDLGFLTAAANTQAIYPIGGSRMRDTTAGCWFYADRSPRFAVGVNSPPLLSSPRVLPASGSPETEFWFSVRYTDLDTNLPVLRAVVIDAETVALRPNQHRYGEGVLFDCRRSGFAPGTHHFNFTFNDGVAAVSSPTDSFTVASVGLAGPAPVAQCRVSASPNPFRDRVTIRLSGPSTSSPCPFLTLSVHDAVGRTRKSVPGDPAPGFVLDLDFLPSGVYFVSAGSSAPLRLVKLQ
jgi:hypothetical protein